MALPKQKLKGQLTVNEQLFNWTIQHAVQMERLKASEIRRIVRFLRRDMIPSLEAAVAKGSANRATKRYKQMLAEVRSVVAHAGKVVGGSSIAVAHDLAKTASKAQIKSLERFTPFAWNFTSPPTALLRSIVTSEPMRGHLLRDWWRGWQRATQTRIVGAINVGIAEGLSIPDIVALLPEEILVAEQNAAAIVRTAVNHVSSNARALVARENDDIVDGLQVHATLDLRTTETCQDWDGHVFELDEDRPGPPFHVGCRTTLGLVLKSLKAIFGSDAPDLPPASRASMNGAVPETVRYPAWLKQQPLEDVEEALGKTKARLFKAGKLTHKQMVDQRGRPLTLTAIAKKEGIEL